MMIMMITILTIILLFNRAYNDDCDNVHNNHDVYDYAAKPSMMMYNMLKVTKRQKTCQ